MLFSIPFIRFNYRDSVPKKNPVYWGMAKHLPFISLEDRSKKEQKEYGVMADKALRNSEILKEMKQG
jgi:hypothetical protein